MKKRKTMQVAPEFHDLMMAIQKEMMQAFGIKPSTVDLTRKIRKGQLIDLIQEKVDEIKYDRRKR